MKLAAQGIFKHIFDNSEESIIIVKDQQVEYVNNYFLEKFKYEIMNSRLAQQVGANQEERKQEEQLSVFKRVKIGLGFLKKEEKKHKNEQKVFFGDELFILESQNKLKSSI